MNQPRFAPEFALEIDGQRVPSPFRACMSSVRLQTGMKGSDRLEFSLFNESLRWLDHPLLKIGNPVRLSMGYASEPLTLMFQGKIVSVQASFPSSGTPLLQVAAQDALSDLQKGGQTRWFAKQVPNTTNLPLSRKEVIRSVLSEYGIDPKFDEEDGDFAAIVGSLSNFLAAGFSFSDPATPQRSVELQNNSRDFDILKKISEELGYDMFIDHSQGPSIVLFFGPWRHLSPAVTLHYGRNLQEFSPRESDAGQVTEVAANIWQSATKQSVNLMLGWNWDSMMFTLRVRPGKAEAKPGSKAVILSEPLTLATAPQRIIAELLPKLHERTTASGATIGNTSIRTGAIIKVTGVGERFGGFYRVTDCSHAIDGSGFRTQFDLRKEVWFQIPKTAQGAVRFEMPSPAGSPAG